LKWTSAITALALTSFPSPSSCRSQEGIDAISEVIYHIETFDVTTIRASTPMFLMSRKIKALGVKMVLSGEGADEVFGGYLYFHKAPDKVGHGGAADRQCSNMPPLSNIILHFSIGGSA
jgi:asparagine synthetase B (glutamine-hydrolysing)